ncbi:hypothetical protein AOT83_06620 [Mycobacteroides sp. H001]|uniref:NAD(P)H-binding protein n=1 Tax=unclassified Mycobacteroides TaxID=2618759 RepID=UPI000715A802|nr:MULTISPECIES: NAD(P)H-binding protein [unclassified Mycobacteroides]KRQ20401.1 hypothetical protein AOT86_23665 [Mycobacteroides sp. H072]KRQ34254.1 hypothetical protein AOT84_18715 [Mycobacteroides sp. H002]KRQ52029.1 hypothetical protein AOT85_09355 [Mycobacteroides sp. H054]KRQ71301.1 hypothetical protein AOT83_06620 [Mycobacteroides sp. H001]
MKYVVTGSAGKVSKPLSMRLLQQGHDVTVVGRSSANLAELVDAGAHAAVGDLADVDFLSDTFAGADGVYLMLPPGWSSPSIKEMSVQLAQGFVTALAGSGVKRVVFLSSYGAHRLLDAGAISGMGLAEGILHALPNASVLALRPGYFYTNLLLSVDSLRETGELGNMFDIPAGTFTLVDPVEIAEVASVALTTDEYSDRSHVYIVSDERDTDSIATLIGREIGKPGLRWSRYTTAAMSEAFRQYGMTQGAIDDYVEMFDALDKGVLFEHYVTERPALGKSKLEDFVKVFADAYRG